MFEAEGDIRSTDVLAALVALWREGTSGTLRFSRSGATSAFELAAGEVIGASSSDPRFDTAAILIRANKLDASTMERLVVPEGADRAYSALEAGILTKREWRWGEKIRAVEVLSDLLTWIEGDYTLFRSGPREAGEFRLTIPRLVLELFLRSRDRGLVLHHLGGADVPLVRDSKFEAEFATFGLTDDAESVVRLIDGESTAAEIAAGAPAEAFAVEKLPAALVTLGLVHPAYAVDPEAAARETVAFPTPAIPEPEPPAPTDAEPEADDEEVEEEEVEEEKEDEEDEEDEPLEPEVDISDKLEEPPRIAPAPEYDELPPEESAASESPVIDAEEEEMVDARLDASGTEEPLEEDEEREAESERESLAADFEPGRSSPDEYSSEPAAVESFEREPEEQIPSPMPLEFQRPLDTSTGVGSLERPRHRSSGTLWILLGMLIAATAAVLYWRARGPSSGTETAALAVAATPSPTLSEQSVEAGITSAPTIAPAVAVPTAMATSVPSAVPTRSAPTRVPTSIPTARPSPRPTSKPAAPAPTAASRAPAAGTAAMPKSRQGWMQRAERDQKSAASDRDARFAIQLELACEVPSLSEAFGHDRPAGNMWVVPTPYRGKTCFRVLWGRYPTREAADGALGSAPAFFSTPRNHPMVVPVR
jgi:hypothetical protein